MMGTVENWRIEKPVAQGKRGVVAAQSTRAARVGAEVLAAGGNAVDAAVATAFALAVAEPWMSGLGGCGCMVVYRASEGDVLALDFGTRAPVKLDPRAFALTGGECTDRDLFGWPEVEGQRNLRGPLSIGVPGSVAGLALALDSFGTLPWADVLAPAIEMARKGHRVDWWTTLKVAAAAAELREDAAAAAVYLPDGLPPAPPDRGSRHLDLGRLPETLAHLAKAGPGDFYEGDIADALCRDMAEQDGFLGAKDLAAYRAQRTTPLGIGRGAAVLHVPPGLTAGPTCADALARLPDIPSGEPRAEAYAAYAQALSAAYRDRLERLGHDGDRAGQASTTHISVADRAGNLVALTNTLLSPFGAKVISPRTGILLNNGIMWFDPRPGRPNSIAPAARPLSNMCPLIATREGTPWFALGASGGRRILAAVLQMTSFLVDCGMTLEAAAHQPRINVDGGRAVEVDPRLGELITARIARDQPVRPVEAMLAPNHYANPLVALCEGGICLGAAQALSPVAGAVGA